MSQTFSLYSLSKIAKYKPLQEIVYDWSKIRQSFATFSSIPPSAKFSLLARSCHSLFLALCFWPSMPEVQDTWLVGFVKLCNSKSCLTAQYQNWALVLIIDSYFGWYLAEVKMHYFSQTFSLYSQLKIAKYKPLQVIVYDWSKIWQDFATWFIQK